MTKSHPGKWRPEGPTKPASAVLSFVLKWRAGQNKSANTYLIEIDR